MAFVKTYDTTAGEIYAEALVECENCHTYDEVAEREYEVEPVVSDSLLDSLDSHSKCPKCGEDAFHIRGEIIRFAIPKFARPDDFANSYLTVNEVIDSMDEFSDKLIAAASQGFGFAKTTENMRVVLFKGKIR